MRSWPCRSSSSSAAHPARESRRSLHSSPGRSRARCSAATRSRKGSCTPRATHRRRRDDLSLRALDIFFRLVGTLVDARVSLVAEAAFQQSLWAPNLTPLLDRARIHLVRCHADPEVAWERINRRAASYPPAASCTAIRRSTRLREVVASSPASSPSLPVPTIDDRRRPRARARSRAVRPTVRVVDGSPAVAGPPSAALIGPGLTWPVPPRGPLYVSLPNPRMSQEDETAGR